jgi:LPXTG-motif cell wall-anchored protein
VTADSDGNVDTEAIWAIPSTAAVTYEDWDIIVDKVGVAGEGTYNVADDGIDDAAVVGFVAPIPELPAVVLLGAGLVGLLGYLALRRRRAHTLA